MPLARGFFFQKTRKKVHFHFRHVSNNLADDDVDGRQYGIGKYLCCKRQHFSRLEKYCLIGDLKTFWQQMALLNKFCNLYNANPEKKSIHFMLWYLCSLHIHSSSSLGFLYAQAAQTLYLNNSL